jgi:hypothetical protein
MLGTHTSFFTRQHAIAAAALAALALIAVGAVSFAYRHHTAGLSSCRLAGAQVLATDPVVQVSFSPANDHSRVYVCLRRKGLAYANGSVEAQLHEAIAPVALSGYFVAYGATVYGTDTSTARLVVLDAATRHTVASLPATTFGSGPESFHSVSDLVVARDGSIAWIARSTGAFSALTFEVHSATHNIARVLDHGPQIVPGSLRLQGGTVSWRNGSRLSNAQLP